MRHILPALLLALLSAAPAGAVGQVVRLSGGFDFAGALGQPTSAAGYAPASGTVNSRFLLETVAELTAVFRFNPQSQAFEYHLKLPAGDLIGAGFDIEERRGYAFRSSARRTFEMNGYVTRTDPVALAAGFNLIACPDVPAFAGTKSLLDASAAVEAVFAWDPAAQGFAFQMRLPGGAVFGQNRALAPGEAVIVRAASAVSLPVLASAAGPDLMLYNAWLDGSLRAGGLAILTLPMVNLGPEAAGAVTVRWTLTPVDAAGAALGGAVAGSRSFGPLAPGASGSFTTEVELPALAGPLLATVAIDDGGEPADPNRANNSTSFLATLLPPALAPVLATARCPVDGSFTVTGLSLAGTSTAEVTATIIGANGWGYPCSTLLVTAASATFQPYWGQTSGPYRVSVKAGSEWAVAGTLEVQPVVAGVLPGHIFRVRGVAYPRIYMSGIAGYGIYSDLNTSDQTVAVDGAAYAAHYMAPTAYPNEGLVRIPGLSAKAGATAQVRFTVNGVPQAADYAHAVPPEAEVAAWWVLDQHGAMPLATYTVPAGGTRLIINGDLRPRSAEVPELGLDTGRLEPGANRAFTFPAPGTYTLNLHYYTLDGPAWVKSAAETKVVVVE